MKKAKNTLANSIALTGTLALTVVFQLILLPGCGDSGTRQANSMHVTGKATFRGQPIKLGLIVFEPDPSQGGSGTQGFAAIRDGEFNTQKPGGQAVAIGPCIIRVTGGDGVGIDAFTPFGNMMFDEFTTKMVMDTDNGELSIEVPASQGFEAPEFR